MRPRSADATAPDRTVPTILVVEDEVLVRMAVAEFLRECGFRIIEASSGEEAVEILKSGQPVDLVFSDVNMSGAVDGFRLAQWIRARRPGVRVLLTSGATRKADVAVDLCDENDVVAKPYGHDALLQRIQSLLRNGRDEAEGQDL